MRGAALSVLISMHLAAAAPRVVAEPPAVVLGKDRFVVLRVSGAGEARLYAECSAGQLMEQGADRGARIFRWTPPDVRFPGTAVLLFWTPRADAPEATVVTLPMAGQTTLQMETEPNASVHVQVGSTTFGPVAADERGQVRLSIQVPPGVREALVTATAQTRQITRTVPLDVPPARAWLVAVAPETTPGDGLWMVVAHGGHLANDVVQVRAIGASVRRASSAANPIAFRLMPDAARAESIELEISAPGHEPRRLSVPISAGDSTRMGWLWANVLGGGFAAGGANAGPAVEVAAAFRLPAPLRSFAAELVVGARRAAFGRSLPDVGRVESRLVAVPVDAAIRYRALQLGRWALDLRAGAGIAPFTHTVSGWYQQTFAEGGVGFDGFGSAQGRYRLGRWELALELRGAFTTARTARLSANPGGLMAMAGAGWAVP
ncbi:MAG TPA: hypothetical protein VE549_14960 [Myxococcaceae bacterium]|nr:hypothetical protein [Myxococcaceae bacterium]